MIGVIASPSDHSVVSEFFQLFKTPWEHYRSGQRYEILLCCEDCIFDESSAALIFIYAGTECLFDAKNNVRIASQTEDSRILSFKGTKIPIYGKSVTFRGNEGSASNSSDATIREYESDGRQLIRIGYDLFAEVRRLLTVGQPSANAGIPALDLHIAMLRDLIVAAGLPLIEIPPVPDGYPFIACLTHDVDHPSIRFHGLDHTTFGFLYRATIGSMFDLLRGRKSSRNLFTNWRAALKLPLIHMGLAKDFWSEFTRYSKIESGLGSSFFVIPFKNRPGQEGKGKKQDYRASAYGASDIAEQIHELTSQGREIGLHGIDAWIDSASGREELAQIRQLTGKQDIGVRMHWLYFDEHSPETLERAGADYDSTVGYNETIGYRAGTAQAYKPLGVTRLLELPLHIMDTALFYPGYLDLSSTQAKEKVTLVLNHASQFGGCITVNWHDRSIAPERLWGGFYAQLMDDLKSKGAWFPTASQAVSWFRKRRSAEFQTSTLDPNSIHVKIPVNEGDRLPGLCLRIYNAPIPRESAANGVTPLLFHDLSLASSTDIKIPSSPQVPAHALLQ